MRKVELLPTQDCEADYSPGTDKLPAVSTLDQVIDKLSGHLSKIKS